MSCQLPSVTSGQANSVISKRILQNSSHIQSLSQVNPQYQCLDKQKQNTHKHQTHIFEDLVPSVLPLLKEYIRLGQAGITDQSI